MRLTNATWKVGPRWLFLLFFLMLPGRLAQAQADITGEWSPRVYNDGMDVGDYTGIPINEAGRLRAESWHPISRSAGKFVQAAPHRHRITRFRFAALNFQRNGQ